VAQTGLYLKLVPKKREDRWVPEEGLGGEEAGGERKPSETAVPAFGGGHDGTSGGHNGTRPPPHRPRVSALTRGVHAHLGGSDGLLEAAGRRAFHSRPTPDLQKLTLSGGEQLRGVSGFCVHGPTKRPA